MFGHDMPRPQPTMDDQAFWAFINDRQLRFQACGDCSELRHPPTPICPCCQSSATEWRAAPEEATVYSYTVIHHASHPAVAAALPYICAVLEFPGLAGVRLVSNIVQSDIDSLHIGKRVALEWVDIDEGQSLPRFKAIEEGVAQL